MNFFGQGRVWAFTPKTVKKGEKKNKEQPKDLSRMYFVSPRSQEYHTKYDANLYKKVMLMISI